MSAPGGGGVYAGWASGAPAGVGLELETSSCVTSVRASPSGVNNRRSVTVKLSCFFSGMDFPFKSLFFRRKDSGKWQIAYGKLRATCLHLLAGSKFPANVTDGYVAFSAFDR